MKEVGSAEVRLSVDNLRGRRYGDCDSVPINRYAARSCSGEADLSTALSSKPFECALVIFEVRLQEVSTPLVMLLHFTSDNKHEDR